MTFEKVKEVFVETINCDEDLITLETRITDDLGMDSLDAVELVMALEETFEISIEEEVVPTFETVEDIVKYVENAMA